MNSATPTMSQYLEEIGSALLSNTGNDVLKLPTQLVHTVKADDSGQVWVLLPRPAQQIEQFDPHFPAHLHYFRKGHSLSIIADGKATIILDPEIIQSYTMLIDNPDRLADPNMILLHIHLQHIELFELGPVPVHQKQTWLEWWREKIQWLHGKKKVAHHREWSFTW